MTKVTTVRQENRVVEYMRDTRSELRKVVWPTRDEAIQLTVVVLFVTLLMSFTLGAMDFLFGRLLDFILSIAGG